MAPLSYCLQKASYMFSRCKISQKCGWVAARSPSMCSRPIFILCVRIVDSFMYYFGTRNLKTVSMIISEIGNFDTMPLVRFSQNRDNYKIFVHTKQSYIVANKRFLGSKISQICHCGQGIIPNPAEAAYSTPQISTGLEQLRSKE